MPDHFLGALPQRKWIKRQQCLGQALLGRLWRQIEDKSPATHSRWQWTWVGDDSLFKKDSQQLGLVRRWWSGQKQRAMLGIDGLLLIAVIGEGKLVVLVDFVVCHPDPIRPGHPCRDKLIWLQVMLDCTWTALQQRRLRLPPPLAVAASWFGNAGLQAHEATLEQGTLVVEGKAAHVFQLPDGRRVKGQDFLTPSD